MSDMFTRIHQALLSTTLMLGQFAAAAARQPASDSREAVPRQAGVSVIAFLDGTPEDIQKSVLEQINDLESIKSRYRGRFEAWVHVRNFKNPDLRTGNWDGTRIYRITPDETSGIDSKLISNKLQTRPPSSNEISDLIRQMSPLKRKIVLISGHGQAFSSAELDEYAGISTAVLGSAIRARQKKEKAVQDILLFYSCKSAGYSHLSMLPPHGIAVVSQDAIYGRRSHVRALLTAAVGTPGTNREAAGKIIDAAGELKGIKTLSAIDLEKMPKLKAAMDNLFRSISDDISRHSKPWRIARALSTAMGSTKRRFSNPRDEDERSRSLHQGDLAYFLTCLEQQDAVFSEKTGEILQEAQNRLKRVVIANTSKSSLLPCGIGFGELEAEKNLESLLKQARLPLKNGPVPFPGARRY